jgi:hypothetical protein
MLSGRFPADPRYLGPRWFFAGFLNLPRRDPRDVNRVADHVSGAFCACRGLGHGANMA